MDELRKMHLKENWSHETDEAWNQEWREELAPEERAYVSGLDRDYGRGILALCSAILVREKVRARFAPEEILELKTVCDRCRVQLRDGRTLLARLGRDGGLRLEELDPALSWTKKAAQRRQPLDCATRMCHSRTNQVYQSKTGLSSRQ